MYAPLAMTQSEAQAEAESITELQKRQENPSRELLNLADLRAAKKENKPTVIQPVGDGDSTYFSPPLFWNAVRNVCHNHHYLTPVFNSISI
jgi:hypothetical protein